MGDDGIEAAGERELRTVPPIWTLFLGDRRCGVSPWLLVNRLNSTGGETGGELRVEEGAMRRRQKAEFSLENMTKG